MMQKIIDDLKNIFVFKESTVIGDIVLVVADQIFYALVTDIERDSNKKDEWWHVSLQLLTIPPQKMTWTLRTEQFTGQEIFTMGGEERFIKAIDFGEKDKPEPKLKEVKKDKKRPVLKVIK